MDWSIGNIIWILIGGAIIGILARFFMPGRQKLNMIITIIIGIVGMFVGDWLAGLLGVKETFGFDWIRHFLQLLVAIAGIVVYKVISGRSSSA